MAKKQEKSSSKKMDSYDEATRIALELAGEKNKSKEVPVENKLKNTNDALPVISSNSSTKKGNSAKIKKEFKQLQKQAKVQAKVINKQKSSKSVDEKEFSVRKASESKTSLVDLAGDSSEEMIIGDGEELVDSSSNKSNFEGGTGKNTGFIETLGGAAMVLIALEIIAIIGLLVFIFLF